jgi:glycosyltransferase involved in cell wall biosynthesis
VCPEDCRRYEITPALRHEQRRRLRLAATDFLVAAIGSCDPNKAFDHAIRELARTDPRSKLLIVGDGSERDGLQRLARDLGVADRIQLVGWRSDMAGVYAAADCVISTSFYDTFPNVIREALACGRPVIVPRHAPPRVYAGISGLLHREGAGLSYDRLRPGALAEQLNRLIGDPRAANEFGRSGYRAAQRLFGWQPTVQRIRLAAGLEADDQSSHAYDPAEPPTAAAEEPGAGAAEVAHTFVR